MLSISTSNMGRPRDSSAICPELLMTVVPTGARSGRLADRHVALKTEALLGPESTEQIGPTIHGEPGVEYM
jgi:hypothetical protein